MPQSMERLLEGTGTLQAEADGPSFPVTFAFSIQYTRPPSRPGLPPPPAQAQGKGNVVSASGHVFPEGIYRLITSTGPPIRVQKLGVDWHILASA
jgi:hypothetical protein